MTNDDEVKFNGKTYRRINGKWILEEKPNIVDYNGKTYKKVYDELGTDPKEACIKKCAFCELDETGEPVCGAPNESFWGCNAGFHWEEV